jgi:hypothetical protein
MDHDPFQTQPIASPPPTRRSFAGLGRGITIALMSGLLLLGGVAAVNAADPSASPAPSTTTPGNDGGTQSSPAPTKDCPADRNGGGSGGSGGTDNGTDNGADSSPDSSSSL